MNKYRTALIDADSLIYICEYDRGPDKAVLELHNRLNQIKEETESEQLALFLSLGKTFRHKNITYKSNRKYKRKSPTFYYLREYMISALNANFLEGVEADDLVTYYGHKYSEDLVCSPDKDVIYSNPRVYNYNKKEYIENTSEDIHRFLCLQLIMGDSGDGIAGIPGIGVKGAEKILNNIENSESFYQVLKTYVDHLGFSKGTDEFLNNFNLLYILRSDDEFVRKGLEIPNEKYDTIEII